MINADAINSHTLIKNHDDLLMKAAECLRQDILEYAKNIPDSKWPPTVEDLSSDPRKPPKSLESFMSYLLKNKDHPNRHTVNGLIQSYSSDLIHGVTRGKVITGKHFLLGLGLHNMTGQKVLVQVMNHLGHCIDYNLVCEIETVQAEAAECIAKSSGALPIKPISSSDCVLTYFWVDNFDMNLKTQTGLNSTHMVTFQEESPLTMLEITDIELPRSKRRSLQVCESEPVDLIVNANKEPPLTFSTNIDESYFSCDQEFPYVANYLLWIIMRKLNVADQTLSTYSGWRTCVKKLTSSIPLKKTVLKYLPPINAKDTEFINHL